MKYILLYIFFQIFSFTVRILPDKACYYLGQGFGKLAYSVTKSRRRVARENLKLAFKDELSEEEISQIIKDVYSHLGQTLVEIILLRRIDKDNVEDYIYTDGEENLQEAFDQGDGVIIYGAHFGNWEWMGTSISLLGYPFNAIIRDQNNSYINEIVNDIRTSKGVNIIPKGMSVRRAIRCLKNGECLLILGDQDARKYGWKVDFFDHPASTYAGSVQLAQRTGAKIVPTFLVREKWGKHRLIFKKPLSIRKNASEAEQKELLQKLNNITESVIRDHKEQWLWLHKRWKTY